MTEPTSGTRSYLFADQVFPVLRIILLAIVTLVQTVLCGVPLLANHDVYDPAWVADAAFVVLALVGAACAPWVLRGRPLPAAVALPGTAVSLLAAAAATWTVPPDLHFSEVDWSFGLVGWHLFLLLAERVAVLIAALCLHVVISLGLFVVPGPPDRGAVGSGMIFLVSIIAFQFAVVVVVWVLHRRAERVGELAAERDRLRTGQALAEQRRLDHRQRFAGQLGATLPLLAGMADGTLDLRAPGTLQRVTLAATQLRRLFAENDDVPDPLVHELSACVDVAERRGLDVSLGVSGETVPVPTAIRRELTGPVITALSLARSRAKVTLLRAADDVRVAVVADSGTIDSATSGSHGTVVAWYSHGQHTRMEARWRPEPIRLT
ncbi:hypothetical protein [Prauserella cavernicola]|uniref:Uncharacterized protein n=1 Tax=Prauserella cavernicola TaxID=2800127 RepID=A0A934V6H1_9PSEU|nr:hypothetical protein [Prauserella cavernicola]MBK1787527.1 hypothetical protein [Prauserella cavernicola]